MPLLDHCVPGGLLIDSKSFSDLAQRETFYV
jgi:hypothetical protein